MKLFENIADIFKDIQIHIEDDTIEYQSVRFNREILWMPLGLMFFAGMALWGIFLGLFVGLPLVVYCRLSRKIKTIQKQKNDVASDFDED